MKWYLPVLFLVTFGVTPLINLHAQQEPRDLLQQNWCEIEVILFEPTKPVFTNESLIHVAEKRILTLPVRTLEYDEQELGKLFTEEDILGRNPEYEDSLFLTPLEMDIGWPGESPRDSINSEQPVLFDENCWVHQLPSLSTTADFEREVLDNSMSDERGNETLGHEISNLRDSRLPAWAPDSWQTLEWSVASMGSLLGLCDEDILFLLGDSNLNVLFESVEQDSTTLGEEFAENAEITSEAIYRSFREFENDLRLSSFSPISDNRRLNSVVNRLKNEDYRVIEHFVWHQPASALNSTEKLLVQFGNFKTRQFREVEGTINLQLGRYLHLDIDLWKILTEPPNFTADNYSFHSPIFYYRMHESRRLRLGEMHYFDHPKFGLLVQVRRVSIPERLIDLFNQL